MEILRQDLNEALTTGTVSEAGLDDWERSVIRCGRATRDRPPRLLLHDLSADVIEFRRLLHARQSASTLRRLTRVAAHMAGLMCLTFCKLDDRPAFRKWTCTARIAADEAGDPVVLAWVLAHAVYGHYYSGDLQEALDVAGHAREVTSTPSVGAALAAALEARAHAAFGHAAETHKRCTLAEGLLERLDGEALIPSAFGYTEAQFRFHEGNASTQLRDTKSAMRAREYALDLCAPGDYTD